MRIAVWNLQGRKVFDIGDARRLVAQFEEKVDCDMLVILEAPISMNFAPGEGRAKITMTHHAFLPGANPAFRKDHIAIFSRVGFEWTLLPLKNADVYAYVITLNKETRFVTFHAPYGENKGAAVAFVNEAFAAMRARPDRPCFAIGDFNTYGDTVPEGYECKLASPTSDRGTGSPLDKVATAVGYPIAGCGRIFDRSMRVDGAKKKGKLDQTKDLIADDFEKLGVPDHLAIYVDIAIDGPLNPPAAAVAPAAVYVDLEFLDEEEITRLRDELRKVRKRNTGVLEPPAARRLADLEKELADRKKHSRDASPVRK